MRRIGISLALAVMLGGSAVGWGRAQEAKDATPAKVEAKADIDLVICLDVSNSMDGLISAAKQKLWDVVNTLAKAKPTPNLRVALYSYGHTRYDAQKGWVRKEIDFTHDLDRIFEKLNALTTGGGTEYVTRVGRDAILDQKWSANPQALKMIFVCGNEPANQDPKVSLAAVAELAVKNDVRINAIYCGGADDPDARTWRELAGLAKGEFSNIDQSKHVVVATPFDKEIAKFADEVNKTYVPFGDKGKAAAKTQDKTTADSKALGEANAAARVQWQNSGLYCNSEWDLVDKRKDDRNFDLAKIPVEQLPANMQKMTASERSAYLDEMQNKRAGIQKKVMELSTQRDAFLRAENEKLTPAARAAMFDNAVNDVLRKQAGEKKIEIPK